jgi:hypothetical protein
MFAKPVKDVAGRQPAYGQTPPKQPAYSQVLSGNGHCSASHDHPSKRLLVRRIDFHMRQESGDMNKISGLYTRDRFSSFAPANLADARKSVRDRLLFPVMMNSRPDPGSTSNRPLQMADAIPSAGAIAARRSEPGVCAVARSNSAGLKMWIAAEELMASRIGLDLQPGS